ncbi:hypothetical protein JKP88DRAFT_253686 [Tribonema minus]|uniref:Uncharacterized protein n=1 Tax=Tribonema minus TaxID=303371 RepID=A0A835ZD74_9STRA|nr:hypothetical protein JKP88DRAFT_253686 [Tribonema minus]
MDYTLTVRSRYAVNAFDAPCQFECQVPEMQPGPYRASVSFIAPSLTGTVAYALQFSAPEIARCLDTSTTGSDSWVTVALASTSDSAQGTFYCDRVPRRLKVRVLIPATLGLAVTLGHHFITIHFKNIGDCDDCHNEKNNLSFTLPLHFTCSNRYHDTARCAIDVELSITLAKRVEIDSQRRGRVGDLAHEGVC